MRRAITTTMVIVMMTMAIPAMAAQTVTISHEYGPQITSSALVEGNETRVSINGHYLWVSFADDTEIVSVDVSDPDIIGAEINDDGTVDLIRGLAQATETVDMVAIYPGTITRLPNGVTVQ